METPLTSNIEDETAYRAAFPGREPPMEFHDLAAALFRNSMDKVPTPIMFIEDSDGGNRIELKNPVMAMVVPSKGGVEVRCCLACVSGKDMFPADALDRFMASFRKEAKRAKPGSEEERFFRYVLEG